MTQQMKRSAKQFQKRNAEMLLKPNTELSLIEYVLQKRNSNVEQSQNMSQKMFALKVIY